MKQMMKKFTVKAIIGAWSVASIVLVLAYGIPAQAIGLPDIHLYGNSWLSNLHVVDDLQLYTEGDQNVVNHSMPGDTSADILAKLEVTPLVPDSTVIMHFGFEDVLAGITQKESKANMVAIDKFLINKGVNFVVSCPDRGKAVIDDVYRVCSKHIWDVKVDKQHLLLGIPELAVDPVMLNEDGFFIFNVILANAWSNVNDMGRVAVDPVLLDELFARHPTMTDRNRCLVKRSIGLVC